MEHLQESPSNDAMRAGMEDVMAAQEEARPVVDEAAESTLPPSDEDDDPLANAPWRAHDGVAERQRVLGRGATIGRFVVLDELGAGAMGVVHAAYDPELDRKVAIKLVRPGAAGRDTQARLLGEAQSLAKLNHPNVVAIHDVGTVGEQVWLAMEFVQGRTLRGWLKTPRSWRDIVRVMRSAGEGLAAAHEAGLLHRDFKPDNVMVGDDGRVRVMDFGLARARAKLTLKEDEEGEEGDSETGLETMAVRQTKAGAIVGTPAYMAPEQFASHVLTAAADQFAFCVTLWEALYGERPFRGKTLHTLAANVIVGRRSRAPRRRGVPTWLRRACERGLAMDPKQRWPSMHALLDTLAKGRMRARVRKGLVAVGMLAATGAGSEGLRRVDVAQRTAACEASGEEIETAWNDERREALREGLVATGVSYAETTADKVMPWLDAQAGKWREARVGACLDANVDGRWDAEMLDRSLWCLDERRMELQSLVDELTRADAGVLPKAVSAVAALSSVGQCRDARLLVSLQRPPSETREDIRAVRADLAAARNLDSTGRYQRGLDMAREALPRAEALQWSPLSAETRLRLGLMLGRMGEFAEAEAMLEDAFFEAQGGVAPDVAYTAASVLVLTVGHRLNRRSDGLLWARHADAALAELPDDGGLRRMALLSNLADIHFASGEYDRSRELHEQALSIGEASLGPSHPQIATTLNHLAIIRYTTGHYDDAEQLYERALEIRTTALGATHPSVATLFTNLGLIREVAGAYDEARRLHEQALSIMTGALGPGHPAVAATMTNLATVYNATGAHERARDLDEQALAIREQALGPNHPDVAVGLIHLASDYQGLRDHEKAKALYERALAILEQNEGPDHPDMGHPLVGLAEIALARDLPVSALAPARRAVMLWETRDVPSEALARARFVLARALWEAPGDGDVDRARALALVQQARGGFRAAGKRGSNALVEVEQWLADHEGDR